jgi:endonuclease YncB( thermonuclease family)
MLKRMIKYGFSLLILLLLSGCGQATTTITTTPTTAPTTTITETTTTNPYVALPDLTGKSRAEITETLTGLGLTIRYFFDVSVIYESEAQYDKFVKYGSALTVGSEVLIGSEVRVYTTPLNLTVTYLNTLDAALQLQPADYAGKEFIADGIGVATVARYVDGDTTWFQSGASSFSVRYLGIDTPESTALYEPWGKAAAAYTQAILENAETIVLQAEGERMDGNGRYLAWVWYRNSATEKFLLLNLELVELAYSKNKVSSGSIFTTVLTLADWNASLTKRRVWGEIDPLFDYSKEGTQMTIEHLMNNFATYVGLKVVVTGTITRMIGNNIFLQDAAGYGVYMYAGFTTSAQLQVGANVTIGGLVPTYYSGSPQLSNFTKSNLSVNTPGAPVIPLAVTYDDFVFNRIGTLVTVSNVIIVYINGAGTSITVKDALNRQFVVRIDDATGISATSLGLSVGQAITVTGPLGYYDYDFDGTNLSYQYLPSLFQLMLTSSDDVIVLE